MGRSLYGKGLEVEVVAVGIGEHADALRKGWFVHGMDGGMGMM